MISAPSNRDQIAGIPAMCIRQFFIECEEPIDAGDIQRSFMLNETVAYRVFERLLAEGHLEVDTSTDKDRLKAIKTLKATRLAATDTHLPLSRENARNVVLALFDEVGRINISPTTAHHITAVTITGEYLIGAIDELSFVEATIRIAPAAIDAALQAQISRLAASHAEENGQQFASEQERENWSVQTIKDRLYDLHPQLCLRFIDPLA